MVSFVAPMFSDGIRLLPVHTFFDFQSSTMPDPNSLIPEQHTGVAKEVHHHITATSPEDAAVIFDRARARLLQVNEWAHTADGPSAKFLLCDDGGNAISRAARQGDLVRIDLPAPGRKSDTGFDWVRLDPVAEGLDDDGEPWIVLTTRPTADPAAPPAAEDTAHFFSEASTGTFVIRRRGTRVEGSHYGRNELPNTGGSLLDKARAVMVTIGAYLGLSDVQWNNLVKGLLDQD